MMHARRSTIVYAKAKARLRKLKFYRENICFSPLILEQWSVKPDFRALSEFPETPASQQRFVVSGGHYFNVMRIPRAVAEPTVKHSPSPCVLIISAR